MPRATMTQLVLVEAAAAAVLGGHAIGPAWYYAGIAVAVVLLPLALVPRDRRWLYQVLASRWGLLRRSRRARRRDDAGAPLSGLLGDYRIERVEGSRGGADVAVVRTGTTWTLPLVLTLDGVTNDDAAVPLDLLAGLLTVEGVPMSSVRLFTLATPAATVPQAPTGPAAPMPRLVARYCLITLDTRRAAAAIADRGAADAAIRQIMRRCAVTTEQVMATADVGVRRLDEDAVAGLFGTWMGPIAPRTGHRPAAAGEGWREVRVGGTWSTTFAVSGRGPDVAERVARLASAAPTPVVGTCLVLRPGRRGGVDATMLVRMSAPDDNPPTDAYNSLSVLAPAYDLVMQRADGEQVELLRATTPLGLGERV